MQGTVSQTVCSCQTLRQCVSGQPSSQQSFQRPGFWCAWQVQGSKQHSPHSCTKCRWPMPLTQYCSSTHSPHFFSTVLVEQTGLHTFLQTSFMHVSTQLV